MVVFTLGSDSGFGIGADGIVDDYDDESGISVILWCIIFVFLLIVTIWFYITQLMPSRSSKCDADDEDEDERVANRLLDHLGAKNVSKSYKESPSCEPSTSSENIDDFEVIDGEVRILYSNYERQAETTANGNESGPKEASDTILRRPSMEEMSLIFPGFLPSISEEDEEELDKSVEENSKETQSEDVYKSNVNNFIEYGESNEKNSFDPNEQRENQFASDVQVISNRKGKQPAASCSTELRRRTYHKDFSDTQHDKTTSEETSNTRNNDDIAAVTRNDHNADEFSRSHESHGICQNMELSTCISGSENNSDPKDQNNVSNMSHTLIIGNNQTVTQETKTQDTQNSNANENISGLDLKRTDTISALAKSNFAVKNDIDEDLVCLEESSEILQEVQANVLEEEDQKENIEKVRSVDRNGLIHRSAITQCSTDMSKHLTHSWTFYAMSEHTNALNGNLEGVNHSDNYDQQSEIPKIVVDFYKDDKRCNFMEESVGHMSWSRMGDPEDSFETDIDVDDVDLDELDMNNSTEGQLNCFFKRHVSVTDLDKILSSSEIPSDGTKQSQDETAMEMDLEDFDLGITVPVGKTNKQFNTGKYFENKNTATTGDQKALNETPVNPQCAMSNRFVKQNFVDQVSDNSENGTTGKLNDGEIKIERGIFQLANTPQNSNARCIIDSAGKTAEAELALDKLSNHDIEVGSFVNYHLEQLNQVENVINNNNNTTITDNQFKPEDNVLPSESKKIMEVELQKEENIMKTDIADHVAQEDQLRMTSRVDNTSNIAAVSNVKDIDEDDKRTFKPNIVVLDNTKQNSHNEIKEQEDKHISFTYKSMKIASTESRKAGLTAEELSGKIDLSRPVSSCSKGEVIIGRRKSKKDSVSKSYTNVTSRNMAENTAVTIGTEEKSELPIVTQYSETKEPEIKREPYKTNRVDLAEKRQLNPEEDIAMEKLLSFQEKSVQREEDLPSKCHTVEKRQTLQPTIKKSVVLIPERSELQTLITIKDIPDTNIDVTVSSNSRLDLTKPRKTSTGLEKAEQIVANRLKRLEDEKKNYISTNKEDNEKVVRESVSCTVSNSREINWNDFLVDGNLLEEVDPGKNETVKCTNFVNDDDILLSPIQAPKHNILENTTQINESFISETMSPREIDWQWCEEKLSEDPTDKRVSLNEENESKISSYDPKRNDNRLDEEDMENSTRRTQQDSCKMFEKTAAEKTPKEDAICQQIVVLATDSFTAKDKSESNERQSTGDQDQVNELHAAIKESKENLHLVDEVFVDNLSEASHPSSEPEFPVRLTRSFSELRTASMNRVHTDDPKFREIKTDRSKSQTDVFEQHDSQNNIFTESRGEQVYRTRITVDEMYANKRRIVILNVRKKSTGKTRCKSMSDLESTSVKKHVFRFKSISSHPEELNQTAGEERTVLKANENTKETIFAVGGSVPSLHDNEATSKTSPSPTSKSSNSLISKKADQIMEETNGDLVPVSCVQQENTDNKAKPSLFTNIEQSSVKGGIPSKVNNSMPTSYTYNESQDDMTDETLYHTAESHSNSIQSELTSYDELADERDNCASGTGRMFAVSRHSPTPLTDSPKSLPRQTSLSPVDGLTEERSTSVSQLPSSGTMFAVSRHSPTSLAEFPTEKSLPRQDSLSPIHDLTKQQEASISSSSSSGTMFAVSRHSPTSLADSPVGTESPSRKASLSPVKDLTKQESVPSSGTLFAVSRHSPPLADSPVESSIVSSVSPSGTMFAVSRHSPTPINSPIKESVISETLTSREIDWQWMEQNIWEDNDTATPDSKLDKSLRDKNAAVDNKSVERSSHVLDLHNRNTVAIEDSKYKKIDHKQFPAEIAPTKISALQISSQRSSGVSTASVSGVSLSSKQKCDEGRALQRQSSLSPELKVTNQSSSRCSSASSASLYGTSRISPSDGDKRLQPSPELTSVVSNSRRSSASSGSIFAAIGVSPSPSMEFDCSNVEEKGLQRKSSLNNHRGQRYRSGTVFAVSGYSSVASYTESRRPRSVTSIGKDSEGIFREIKKPDKEKREVSPTLTTSTAGISSNSRMQDRQRNNCSSERTSSSGGEQEKPTRPSSSVTPPSDSANGYTITNSGWLEKVMESETSHRDINYNRQVMVTDLDSVLNGTNSTVTQDTQAELKTIDEATITVREEITSQRTITVQSIGSIVTDNLEKSSPTMLTSSGLQETDLDAILFEKMNSSSSKPDKREETLHSRSTSHVKTETNQRSKILVTSSTIGVAPVQIPTQDALAVSKPPPCNDSPVFDDFDDEVFTNTLKKTIPRGSEASYSSDADSETSSLSSVPLKLKSRHTRASLEAAKPTPSRLSQSSNSSSATPITTEKDDPELNSFFPPNSTSTPEDEKSVDITRMAYSMSREAAKEPGQNVGHVNCNAEGIILLKDSSYGAPQPKTRTESESRTISTEVQRSAFTPVRSRTKDGRSVSQEYILDGITAEPEKSPKKTLNYNSALEGPTFKEMADSHKSMPDLHNVHEESEVDSIKSPTSVPYHSRLSTHTRLWLSQTAGIDTSDICKDESGGSEIFLFPSNRFQPGKNVDASFLSLVSETEDIDDDVSTRPSSPMSEFSFAGETPFGGEYKDELNIISCGHTYCGNEEVLRGQEKTSFTSCPSCYTYYCSRECRQAHWRQHKKSCHFGRINSYMRSFIYFCHKKENLKLLLSKIATKNYPSKGRGCVMVTFASAKQARKFMTSGCVLLPSPPSYSPLRNLMREGVVSKHKVNLVQQVKDYDPTHEFVLNLAVVAGRLEDLPRHPEPRHKLNTVLQCIKIPLSDSLIEQPKTTALDTSQETRFFYLPKCSRHEFVNDMEARRHYCRNISKSLKQYGIRLKKDYPEAYDNLCLYVENNLPFKPLTVYGNQNSKIVACRIMPEGSSSAV